MTQEFKTINLNPMKIVFLLTEKRLSKVCSVLCLYQESMPSKGKLVEVERN